MFPQILLGQLPAHIDPRIIVRPRELSHPIAEASAKFLCLCEKIESPLIIALVITNGILNCKGGGLQKSSAVIIALGQKVFGFLGFLGATRVLYVVEIPNLLGLITQSSRNNACPG